MLFELRSATKAQHDVLDNAMPLAKQEADWNDYLNHLHILLSWLSPLEQWLYRFNDGPQGKGAPEFIFYSHAILAELKEAQIEPAAQFAMAATWPKNDDAAYRWGISYVIEGAQLGGEFLYNRLAERLAPHKLNYLQRKSPGRWNNFLQAMALNVTEPKHISAACTGAMDAFDALLEKLNDHE